MNTYYQLHAHLVFSTQGRKRLLRGDFAKRVHARLGAILREEDAAPLCIGGYEDHVHLLIGFRPAHRLSDVVRVMKARCSKWINEESTSLRPFAWQRGYSIFSVSHSQLNVVRRYIERQEQHHRERSFLDELKRLLALHDIEFDPSISMNDVPSFTAAASCVRSAHRRGVGLAIIAARRDASQLCEIGLSAFSRRAGHRF